MEFVHRHEAHIGMGAFAQSLIGEDFGGAADDRRVRVDVAVTGDHADIVAPEHFDQVEEFLRHQRLDPAFGAYRPAVDVIHLCVQVGHDGAGIFRRFFQSDRRGKGLAYSQQRTAFLPESR